MYWKYSIYNIHVHQSISFFESYHGSPHKYYRLAAERFLFLVKTRLYNYNYYVGGIQVCFPLYSANDQLTTGSRKTGPDRLHCIPYVTTVQWKWFPDKILSANKRLVRFQSGFLAHDNFTRTTDGREGYIFQ